MRRLEGVAADHAWGGEDARYGLGSLLMAVWAVVAKNFPALLGHPDVILHETLRKDAVINTAVCVDEEDNLLPFLLPFGNLIPKVGHEDVSWAPPVSKCAKISPVLVVDCFQFLVVWIA
jgi:hypothetical protein